jgi:hypothetical protein
MKKGNPIKTNLPCWLSSDDKEIAELLLALNWIWLEDEEPECWEDKGWEYKIGCCHGWQFWAVPGDTLSIYLNSGIESWSYWRQQKPSVSRT